MTSFGACTPSSPGTSTPAPGLRLCAAEAPASFPCRTPFDIPPVLEQQPAIAEGAQDQRAPHVWIFVDEAGVVRATQVDIDHSAGIDYDFAAVRRAKEFRFRPATAGGRAVPAWVLMAVNTPRPPPSCPSMPVPLSAGYAALTDSTRLERPELGTLYRFRGEKEIGLGGIGVDVFIYPAATWPPPAEQAKLFLQAMEILRQEGRVAAFEVIEEARETFRVGPSGRTTEVRGHSVRLRLTTPAGEALESYFGVFPDAENYVKFRATYVPTRAVRDAVHATIGQILAVTAMRPAGCPRWGEGA